MALNLFCREQCTFSARALRSNMYSSCDAGPAEFDVFTGAQDFSDVFFHCKVVGACPVTADWILGDEVQL